MKKYLMTMFCIISFSAVCIYMVYFQGLYIPFPKDSPLTVSSTIREHTIRIKKNNQYEDFVIKGVTLPSSIAGHRSSDFAIDKETYLKWFALIQKMGANTIRTYTIYDSTFYNAFFEYNENSSKPLYLLQGIQVTDYANNSKSDAYGKDFYYSLKKDARDIVDVIHGKKIISINKVKGSGIYSKDVSPWVLGYIIGSDWNLDTVAFTDHNEHPISFEGTYFSTSKDATPFEVMLAKVMDTLISYETAKYNTQSLITFSNSTLSDPLESEEDSLSQSNQYVSIDPNHIIASENLKSGYFASYKLESMNSSFADTKETRAYLKKLQSHHKMPVIISDFGYSTSRGVDDITGAISEEEQGKEIVKRYQTIRNSGFGGAFINSWQDSWDRSSWNTVHAVDKTQIYLWHDIQSKSTGYGILGFRSNENTINGSKKDWPNTVQKTKYQDTSIYSFSDEKGLYLFFDEKDIKDKEELLIALDITPKSGSKQYDTVQFNKGVDFILTLSKQQGQFLVHSRYDSTRENYLSQINGENPFINPPSKDDTKFELATQLCKDLKTSLDSQIEGPTLQEVFNTGTLLSGNTTKNSLTDYCFSSEGLELRIPWQLLNISNPVDMEIHDDYYENFGVIPLKIKKLYLGFGDSKDKKISLTSFKFSEELPKHFDEYLKSSYSIIQSYWRDDL